MTEQLLRPRSGSRFLGREKFGSMQALLRRLPIETYVVTFTLVLWIALSLATSNFLTENNVSNMMRQTSIAAIVAIGVMFTIVIAGIDLSVGSVAAFCGVAFAQMCRHGLGLTPAVLLTLFAGGVVGSTNALAIGRLGIPAFIVTLAGLQSYRGLALLLAGGMTVGGLPAEVKDFAGGTTGLPNLFWAMLGVALAAHYFLRFTRTGRYLYAMGSNAEAARRQGIDTFRITLIAYVVSSALPLSPAFCSCRASASRLPPWPTPTSCRRSPQRWLVGRAYSVAGARCSGLSLAPCCSPP